MADTVRDLADDFLTARGVPDDVEWARSAAARLALEDVRPHLARRGLAEAREQVAATGESPADLFGDPVEWVGEQRAAWREDGEAVGHASRRSVAFVDLSQSK